MDRTGTDRSKTESFREGSLSGARYRQLEADLTRRVGTRVRVIGGDRGRIELHFHSQDELQRLLELLDYQP